MDDTCEIGKQHQYSGNVLSYAVIKRIKDFMIQVDKHKTRSNQKNGEWLEPEEDKETVEMIVGLGVYDFVDDPKNTSHLTTDLTTGAGCLPDSKTSILDPLCQIEALDQPLISEMDF